MQEITREPWTVRKTSHGYVVEHNFKTADGQGRRYLCCGVCKLLAQC